MLKKIFICYHEHSRELAADCGAMSNFLITSKILDVLQWVYNSIAEGEENGYYPIIQDKKDALYVSILYGEEGLLTLYNKGDEASSLNWNIVVKQYDLDLDDTIIVNEQLIPRIQQLMDNPKKAEKFIHTLIEQIKFHEDSGVNRGYIMAKALLENSLDGFLVALCGLGMKNLLDIVEFRTESSSHSTTCYTAEHNDFQIHKFERKEEND